jgi:hypothetical protein
MVDIVERLRNWEKVDIVDAHEDGALYNAAADEIEELREERAEMYDLIKRIYIACLHEEGSGVVGFTGEVHMSQDLFDDIFEAVNDAVYHTGSMWPKGTKHD